MDSSAMFFWGFVAFILLIYLIVIIEDRKNQNRLKKARQKEAEEAGLDFQEKDLDFENWLILSEIYIDHIPSRVRNIIRGSRDKADFAHFLFSFSTGGKSSHREDREATILTLKNNAVPDFVIHKRRFGLPDSREIKLPTQTAFGENFRLYGEDSEAIQRLFTPEVQECFLGFLLEQAKMRYPYFTLVTEEHPNLTSLDYIQTGFEILEILRTSSRNISAEAEKKDDDWYRIDAEAEKQRMFGDQQV